MYNQPPPYNPAGPSDDTYDHYSTGGPSAYAPAPNADQGYYYNKGYTPADPQPMLTATNIDYSQDYSQSFSQNAPVANDPAQHGEKFVDTSYRDLPWALAFLTHLVVLFITGMVYFGKFKSKLTVNSSADTNFELVNTDLYSAIVVLIFFGAGVSAFWVWFAKTFPVWLIYFTIFLSVTLQLLFSIALFVAGSVGGGIVMLLFAILSLVYAYWVRNRIAFASAMLKIVGEVITLYPAPVMYSLGAAIVQGLWMMLWVLCAMPILFAADTGGDTVDQNGKPVRGDSSGAVGFLLFILVLSFFWTSQVIKNVVHVTSAGLFATWYFFYPNQMPQNPTNKAFKRAITTSFGSICLGSLLIAVIKTLRSFAEQGRRNENNFLRACAACLLSCLEAIIEYFNKYAFTMVAMYGKPYFESGKAAWELLKLRGFDAVINDDLIGGVIGLGSLVGAALGGVVGLLIGKYMNNYSENYGIFVLVGALIGFAMTFSAMEVIESCVASLFVCYAENPLALAETKPLLYSELTTALSQFYSGVYIPDARV